jgi:crotonobetainyl-CoA:carnitine CoA-transferase CaiB-like acyl-CoA transferase
VAVAATSEAEWRTFCDVVGVSELKDDARFATNADRVDHRA